MLTDQLRTAGSWAPVWMYLLFVGANLVAVPATVLTLIAGAMLGFGWAVPVAALARPSSAALAYGLVRRVVRARVREALRSRPRADAVDRALHRGGFRLVVLLRLSPLFPSTLSNYILGATRVGFVPFVAGSALGTLPSTVLYSYLGAGLSRVGEAMAADRPRDPREQVLFWAGLAVTVGVVWWISRLSRRQLQQALEAPR